MPLVNVNFVFAISAVKTTFLKHHILTIVNLESFVAKIAKIPFGLCWADAWYSQDSLPISFIQKKKLGRFLPQIGKIISKVL